MGVVGFLWNRTGTGQVLEPWKGEVSSPVQAMTIMAWSDRKIWCLCICCAQTIPLWIHSLICKDRENLAHLSNSYLHQLKRIKAWSHEVLIHSAEGALSFYEELIGAVVQSNPPCLDVLEQMTYEERQPQYLTLQTLKHCCKTFSLPASANFHHELYCFIITSLRLLHMLQAHPRLPKHQPGQAESH